MLDTQTQIALIKYEVEHLRYFDKQIQALESVLGALEYDPPVPCNNYEIYSMILDDLGVPPDAGFPGRDPYWNLYLDLWSCEDWDKNKDKRVKNLINDILKMLGKKNENKKRVRKQ
jgi:hypothetical protein